MGLINILFCDKVIGSRRQSDFLLSYEHYFKTRILDISITTILDHFLLYNQRNTDILGHRIKVLIHICPLQLMGTKQKPHLQHWLPGSCQPNSLH